MNFARRVTPIASHYATVSGRAKVPKKKDNFDISSESQSDSDLEPPGHRVSLHTLYTPTVTRVVKILGRVTILAPEDSNLPRHFRRK